MNSGHLPFSQPIPLSRPINTLLRVRNATTCVEQECFPESAGQAGLRWGSTVRKQERRSCRGFFFQVRQDLLNDHRILDTGNDPDRTSTDSARLNIDTENLLQSLRPAHRRMTLNRCLLLLAIRCFGLVAFPPFCRCHQRPVFAARGEYTVKARQIDSGPGQCSQQEWLQHQRHASMGELVGSESNCIGEVLVRR
jgi:hypothetical protein